jgi:uncharacterized protein YbjT (DUF2867 family)
MNADRNVHAVTGAFSYTGRYIAQRLLAQDRSVITLTGHPDRPNPFAGRIKQYPFSFENPRRLMETLSGVDVLYNTYWVRFSHGETTFEKAVQNTKTLFDAARDAGVRRIVHVSITNPSTESKLPYFRGKAQLEQYLQASGVSYAILRPTVVFGLEDILLNNIAFMLRRFPVFAMPGSGEYKLQPVYVDDLAHDAVQQGLQTGDRILDVVGPETFSFRELVMTIRRHIGSRSRIVSMPPSVALALSRLVGLLVRDVVLTRDEVTGLLDGLLSTDSPPLGQTRFSEWARENAQHLGRRYASELARHYREAQRPTAT